jgi:glycogen synthase
VRILAISRNFLPNLGGLETAADALTRAWAEAGHEVVLATETPGEETRRSGVAILRRPAPGALLAATRRAEIVWHNHLSLRAAWTHAIAPRPWVVTHQGWIRGADGGLGPMHRLKRSVARRAHAVAISKAIADDLPMAATVIPNPYRDRLFRNLDRPRPFVLAFLGRFVSDKGAGLLIDALARLKSAGRVPALLMIGEGPEGVSLRALAARLGVANQVEFAGPLRDEAVVEALNAAEILVVPSLYREPFGIVALEGIACGCAIVASAGGGLPEAVGPCGLTFPNGDAQALSAAIGALVDSEDRRRALRAGAAAHLAGFTAAAVAQRYLSLFQSVIAGSRG